MPVKDWLLNLIIFTVVMEADLGLRTINWFRVLRPLLTSAAIVPLFVSSVPTSGNNAWLEVAGVLVGVLLGLAAHLFLSVTFAPARGDHGRPVSRAAFGYAAYWAVIYAGRLVFIYGTYHWFHQSLGQFLVSHQLSGDGLADALVFMAVAMALARSALLGVRGRAVTRRAAAGQPEPVFNSQRSTA